VRLTSCGCAARVDEQPGPPAKPRCAGLARGKGGFRGPSDLGPLVVFKIDRLARRLREGLDILGDWCDRGVRFVSITQQVDVSGTMGRMIAALMLGLAEIEWEYRKERQAAGIAVAKRNGVYRGRTQGTTKGQPDRARELQAKGLRAPEIAQALGVSPRTVFCYLQATES
jgi:DNA invertase Pin-like site-specific DNA recombinase